MWRSGIYKLKQLRKNNLHDLFGKEKNISVYMYKKLVHETNYAEKDFWLDVILNRFNSDRNVVKRTYKNRFDQFDEAAIKEMIKLNMLNPAVMDIAVSDGRASTYFLQQLLAQSFEPAYRASDLVLSYTMQKKHQSAGSYIVTDEGNNIKEIVRPPFVWNLSRREGKLYFINNKLKRYYSRFYQNQLKKGLLSYSEQIELLHPDFVDLLRKCRSFELINYSLFKPVPGRFDVIRAMNILHYGYFTEDQLLNSLYYIYNAIEMDGLFIEGSNENAGSEVEGGIYRKTPHGFVEVCTPQKNSRIGKVILSIRPVNANNTQEEK